MHYFFNIQDCILFEYLCFKSLKGSKFTEILAGVTISEKGPFFPVHSGKW